VTLVRIGRSAAGLSLLTTGLAWTCWQVLDNSHGCPPLGAWVAISLIGFALLPKRWGRKARREAA